MRFLVLAATAFALLAGSARAGGGPVLGFTVSSGARTGSPVALPSAGVPNAPGAISVPASFTTPPLTSLTASTIALASATRRRARWLPTFPNP